MYWVALASGYECMDLDTVRGFARRQGAPIKLFSADGFLRGTVYPSGELMAYVDSAYPSREPIESDAKRRKRLGLQPKGSKHVQSTRQILRDYGLSEAFIDEIDEILMADDYDGKPT